ncbi:hypothetical protein QFC22_001388 [Naganishia vaughanmartiniae]|uniref:Uncharacterized protein n=1 Tax=Naganishia vaughanmartiniae TaxID=1424756 RepID=A0ACC2XIH2_9TREE|nr:hypothetical protein QFC22_001388 [Naganishia vaughanmartiniae]
MSAPSFHHQAPLGVQTHAESVMQMYQELVVPGFEQSSQVFALVAESLGQKPLSNRGRHTLQAPSDTAPKRAETLRHSEVTYQPQGLSKKERDDGSVTKGTTATAGKGRKQVSKIDSKTADRRKREWVRRLKAVFDFEVTLSSNASPTNTSSTSASPTHFYIDLHSTGRISLKPPAIMHQHGDPAEASTWARRSVVKITISDRDLLAVAIGERVPVKLFSAGRLRIKGDIHKALLLGKLLSVTRSQIYADADAESPSHDLYDARPSLKTSKSTADNAIPATDYGQNNDTMPIGGDLDAQGMQGQGAPAGGPEWGAGGMGSQLGVRAKL